jgi:hypothetical protein
MDAENRNVQKIKTYILCNKQGAVRMTAVEARWLITRDMLNTTLLGVIN